MAQQAVRDATLPHSSEEEKKKKPEAPLPPLFLFIYFRKRLS